MDILLRLESATAVEVQAELPEAPGYSAVRTMLGRLEKKGQVAHTHDGPRYIYTPAIDRDSARQSALERTVRTFFDGSPGKTVAALLDRSAASLSDAELDDLADMIRRMREGRK